jgi:hypothetical protein
LSEKIPPNGGVREKKKEQRAKEQEYKGLLSPRRTTTHNPKTNMVVAVDEIADAAISRTAIFGIVVPRTTAHELSFASTNQSTAIYRRVYIIFIPVIFAPFPHISVHIV